MTNKDTEKNKGIMRQTIPSPIGIPKTKEKHRALLQGRGTNEFSQITTSKTNTPKIDSITGTASISTQNVNLLINKFDALKGELRTSTHKLLDILVMNLTHVNSYRSNAPLHTSVSLSLDEYMELCGYPNTKSSKDRARRKVKEDLEMLYNISLEWEEPKGRTGDYIKTRIISWQSIKNNIIEVVFAERLTAYLVNAYVSPFPLSAFEADERNPNVYSVWRKLVVYYSMDSNIKAGRHNIIGVKSLLEACSTIPTFEEVAKTSRHYTQRIIEPLEKALDSIEMNWHYVNAKKEPLTKEQLNNFDYNAFIDLYVQFELFDVPEPLKRIEK